MIATNDAHYLTKDDVEAHDALLCVLTGRLIKDEKRLRYTGTEYLKSEENMKKLFADHLDEEVVIKAINNIPGKTAQRGDEFIILKGKIGASKPTS